MPQILKVKKIKQLYFNSVKKLNVPSKHDDSTGIIFSLLNVILVLASLF